MKIDSKVLETKAWYRIMKVVLIIAAALWTLAVGALTISEISNEYPFTGYHYQLNCKRVFTSERYVIVRESQYSNETFSDYHCAGNYDTLTSVSIPIYKTDYTFLGYFLIGSAVFGAGIGLLYLIRFVAIYIVYGNKAPTNQEKK